MRILAVQETDWIERNPIMHHRMLESLSRAGDEVVVIDFDINWSRKGRFPIWQKRSEIRGFYRFFKDSDVTIVRPGMLRLLGLGRISWLLGNWREIRRVMRKRKPDVLVAYGISNALLGYFLARRASVPFVYHVMDALHTLAEPAALRPLARMVEAMTMRRADTVIVINRHLREYAVSMGAKPDRVEVIPAGWERNAAPGRSGEDVRLELGVAPEDFLLVFVGWLYRFSGMRELAVELGRRRDELPTVKCLVVGDGDLLEELTQLARSRRIEDKLLILGRRPATEIRGLIAAADACLLPAHPVSAMLHVVPVKVGEYMQAAKLIIATRLPGLEVEFGSLSGLLLVEGPSEVLDRTKDLLQDPVGGRLRAKQLGEANLAFVKARDDWGAVTRRFRAVLKGPCDRAARL